MKTEKIETGNLTKVAVDLAIKICNCYKIDDSVKPCLDEKMSPSQFLELLLKNQFYPEAVRFLAHGLPKREAVWWAYVCAEQTEKEINQPEIKDALEATKAWVYQPNEETRRIAEKAAEKSELKSAASWAAMAAFWSSGSITPPTSPPVMANEYLTAQAVSGAVMLAASLYHPEKIQDNYRYFLKQGIHIANGGNGSI